MLIIFYLIEGQPVIESKNYYTSDQINSTRINTDSSGSMVYSAVFDPYGGMQKQWVNTYSPSLKFSGKERDVDTELDFVHQKNIEKKYKINIQILRGKHEKKNHTTLAAGICNNWRKSNVASPDGDL